ncbi:Oidioi.mRNA.OKI2018_I69.XSR.g16802.t1.cds [Oikopleura dioica]|uniref:Oidioi.mRNA.OKI2018_I69.XSR.g16802.t1.cds n=1 Tax=Oikopleura dioica TaxID=34765 RepID=A0ABN7SRM3_OIKDI|nr:Oidioi.mRNA.OKI2018_I69.XSR.g16802.t1.cds [Oikopleura dioica]
MWVCVEERVGEISHFAKIRRRIVFDSIFALSQGRIPEIGDEVTYYDNCNVHRATFLCSSETRNFTPKDLIANLLNSEEDLRLFAASNGIGEPQTQTIVELTLEVFLFLLAKFERNNLSGENDADFDILHEDESRTASSATDFDLPVIETIETAVDEDQLGHKSPRNDEGLNTCTDDERDATELDSMEIPELEPAPLDDPSHEIANCHEQELDPDHSNIAHLNLADFIKIEPESEFIPLPVSLPPPEKSASPSKKSTNQKSRNSQNRKSSKPKKLKSRKNQNLSVQSSTSNSRLENSNSNSNSSNLGMLECNLVSSEILEDIRISTNSSLENHKFAKVPKLSEVELGERPFPCEHCAKSYKTKRLLDAHLRRVHQVCVLCSLRFESDKELQIHREISHKVRKYYCHLCLFWTNKESALENHVSKIHPRENQRKAEEFTCDHCKKVFSRKHQLKKHQNLNCDD